MFHLWTIAVLASK